LGMSGALADQVASSSSITSSERRSRTASGITARRLLMRLVAEMLGQLAGARTEEEIVGPGGVLAQLTKRLVERALSADQLVGLGPGLRRHDAPFSSCLHSRPHPLAGTSLAA
jgi:hypothetical protein